MNRFISAYREGFDLSNVTDAFTGAADPNDLTAEEVETALQVLRRSGVTNAVQMAQHLRQEIDRNPGRPLTLNNIVRYARSMKGA